MAISFSIDGWPEIISRGILCISSEHERKESTFCVEVLRAYIGKS